eukprot:s4386_g1.t1
MVCFGVLGADPPAPTINVIWLFSVKSRPLHQRFQVLPDISSLRQKRRGAWEPGGVQIAHA